MPLPTERRATSVHRATTVRRVSVVLGIVGAVLGASVVAALPGSAATTTSRVWGADRYATAVQLAQSGYPHGAPTVFLASGTNFPDALGAGPAAAKAGGPLLLTDPNALPDSVAAELAALAPSTVYVVGGSGAVSDAVEAQVEAAVPAATVTRLDGADRYATGRAVVSAVFPTASTAFIATGAGFADALSAAAAAGSVGAPVVLVNDAASSLDAATVSELTSLGVTSVVIAGGTGAVSAGIQAQLDSLVGSAHVSRLGGADRYATSALIAQASFTGATTAYFASGVQFPDALAASAIAGAQHAPLFTVEPGCVPDQTLGVMTGLGVSNVVVAGGTGAVSANVQALAGCQAESASAVTLSLAVGAGSAVHPGPGGSPMFPQGVAVDATGDLFIADSNNDLVEKVTPAGAVSVVAGNGTSAAPRAGAATSSPLGSVQGIALDAAGDLYIADGIGYVEKVTPSGVLSVVAGDGGYGAPAPGAAPGSATATAVVPSGVAVDPSGNLFIADANSLVVLKVTPAGALSIVAGNGVQAAPSAGVATSSPVDPSAIATDGAGNVYVTDWNGYVLKVTPAGGLAVIAGNGSWDPPLAGAATRTSVEPGSIAADAAGDVYVSGWEGDVEKISPSGALSVVAGDGTPGAPTAGSATGSHLGSWIDGLAVDGAGTLYIADASNGVIERVVG